MNTNYRMLGIFGLTLGLALASEAFADNAVAAWNVVLESTLSSVPTPRKNVVALPYAAYVNVAMYDAVNSIDGRYQPFAVSVNAPQGASEDAAAASAAHDVLVYYATNKLGATSATLATLDAALATSLAAIPAGTSKTDGINVGKSVAAQWLALRAGDGLEAAVTYTPGSGPGVWAPVPPFPPPVGVWLRQFRPFALDSADQFLDQVHPPLKLTSTAWARDFNLTKTYGAKTGSARSDLQTEIGLFWTDSVVPQYGRTIRGLIGSQGLDTAASARLFAMIAVAVSDAGTACMNAKYHFAFWRPYAAIHEADTDNNPGTVVDPNWLPLAVTPGHPEYPANHGCVTQAFANALTAFFKTDESPYTVSSDVTGTSHSFISFADVVREVDTARIYGGMHFRHSVDEGNRLGRMVTRSIFKKHFRLKDAKESEEAAEAAED